jgi:hypothetical protein
LAENRRDRRGGGKREAKDPRTTHYLVRRNDSIASVINSAFKYTAICVIGYFCYRAGLAFAGQTTTANINVSVALSEAVAWMFGASGTIYGLRERGLRRKVNASAGARTTALERRLDPGRTSSQLTSTGETNPQDEL